MASLDTKGLPVRVQRAPAELSSGAFVDCDENLLVFGLPGRRKVHAAAPLGSERVQKGWQVPFSPTPRLVDRLLRAKRGLVLEPEPRGPDRLQVLNLD